ncbi:MAG: FAD-binding oxidoreductase [Proteobacteria bacterium]|nr:FAD-binding oxidoreductase [Pseudomonadota bacterium]
MSGYDVAVVGAGIAGASLAARLAEAGRRVLLIEMEDRPGYHTTGRSAAFWHETLGGPLIQPLTVASGEELRSGGFLAPRAALNLAEAGDEAALDAFIAANVALGVRVERLTGAALAARVPGLKPGWTSGALEPDGADIDVAALHQHYLARARQAGCEVRCRAGLARADWRGGHWQLAMADGSTAEAGVLANAAGAWADQVAGLAGARPLGIQPKRRTIAVLRTNPAPPADLPLTIDLAGSFYFRPDGARLWLSPHDETDSEACDAAPEELDVAIAIDRMEQVVDWKIERVEARWAGLRSFAPDRVPVFGFDPAVPGLFWCAGQGGVGIQTAPAASRLAAQLLLGERIDWIDPAPYAPARFA